ncbi:MAG: hypothetical protein LBK72_04055, partial [Bifidobacteriaceae bacterium]|nr:hypothetical protein [Bifidobacteriaceae bacterium]
MNTLKRPAIVGAALLGLVLTASAGIAPVTAGAQFIGDSHVSTAARAATADTGLKVGAAKMVISGLMGTDDLTYPNLNEYELEKLWMRAIVIENNGERAALIAADLSGIDEGPWAEMWPKVAEAIDAPEENIVITSTHVHSDRPQGFDNNPGGGRYGRTMMGTWAETLATEALANLQPARMGYGTGELHLAINRDTIDPVTKKWTQAGDINGVTDTDLNVLTFYSAGTDLPIATYFAYPMHPVNGYLTQNTSGDFPAAASRYIENAFGGDMVAVYNQGAGGDINPRWLRAGTNVLASLSGVSIPGYELVREDVEAPIRNNEVTTTRPDPDVLRELFDYEQAIGAVIGEEAI